MSSKTDNISTQQWLQLQKIFDEAMDLPAEDRTAFVAQSCDSEMIKNQVEALLLAAESEQELVGDLIRSAADSALEQSQTKRSQIGTFKIVKVIGTGGMGVVYLAERDDAEFHHQVAIKILHDGLVSEDAIQRFRTERQILAELNHPNIAKLLDGGHTKDDKPYLVMEYIDGEPLVEYCDRRSLGITERLDLFTQVCSAVAAAHRSLIVHRDIKPSNILVGSDGIPKLLDFGIAKVLNNRLLDVDLAKTQMHERLLTPDNASPEQVTGRPVTTASDIYSLGVLLYQLLCGSRPFRLSNATPAEMERTICNEVPNLPSHAIGDLKDRSEATQEKIAQQRSMTVSKLRAKLKGELDNIVMKSIKKEPQARYVSASQFASDIGRYHRGLPVVAANDTRRYRARKFVSRNRIAVVAAATFVLALSIFTASTYFQAQEIAAKAREIVEEKAVTEDALNLLSGTFQAASPGKLQKKEVTAVDILDVGARKLSELPDRTQLSAKLHRTLGVAYGAQGADEKALFHLQSALEDRLSLYGDDHPQVADVLQNLGDYYRLVPQLDLSSDYYALAMKIFTNGISQELYRDNPAVLKMAIQNLYASMARLETDRAAWALAREYTDAAFNYLEQARKRPEYVSEKINLYEQQGSMHRLMGEYQLSIISLEEALRLARGEYGEQHTRVSVVLNGLALAHHSLGELDEAEDYYRRSLEIDENVYEDDSWQLTLARSNFARFLRDRGEYSQAQAIYEKVIRTHRASKKPLDISAGFDMVEMAKLYVALNQFPEAEAFFDKALETLKNAVDGDHIFIAEAHRQHANLRVLQGQHSEALLEFDKSLAMLARMLRSEHWQTAATNSEKSEALLALNRSEEALVILDESLPILEDAVGSEHRLYREAKERRQRAYSALQVVVSD